MIYADSAVLALGLEQALACKTGCPLLARSLWARFRQPRRQSFLASYGNSSLKQALNPRLMPTYTGHARIKQTVRKLASSGRNGKGLVRSGPVGAFQSLRAAERAR